MPKRDGTGPKGKGPMTGWGSGYCVIPLNTPEEEANFLKNQEKVIKEHLQHVERRLKSINKSTGRRER